MLQRGSEAYALRQQGLPFSKIGRKFGVSSMQASLYYRAEVNRRALALQPLENRVIKSSLSSRAKSRLLAAGLKTRQDVQLTIEVSPLLIRNMTGIGRTTYQEILNWAAQSAPPKHIEIRRVSDFFEVPKAELEKCLQAFVDYVLARCDSPSAAAAIDEHFSWKAGPLDEHGAGSASDGYRGR